MKVLVTEKISEHKFKDNSGYLICTDCVCARTGKQVYTRDECFGDGDDTEIEVDRKEEDVFSEETLASFENKPLTIQHPNVDVNPDNHKELSFGYLRDVHKGTYEDKPVMMGTIVVTDAEAIRLVESGELTNLSCGYDCDVEDVPNPCQKNIRGNHIALCDIPRAGNTHIQDSKDNSVSFETLKDLFDKLSKAVDDNDVDNEKKYLADLENKLPFKNNEEHGKWLDISSSEFWEDFEEFTMDIMSRAKKARDRKKMRKDGKNYTKLSLYKVKNEYGEYCVKCYADDKYSEIDSYYTDDWQDAVDTFNDMAKRLGLTPKNAVRNHYTATKETTDSCNAKDELSTLMNVHAEDITYEGDDEPDIEWLQNRYNVKISYDGDTNKTYTIKGEEKDIDRFARDHHLTRDSRRKNDEKPLHVRHLEEQVSKNKNYSKMARLACKGHNDLYQAYFYAFKDAHEKHGYKPTNDDIQGELRDAFYQEADTYQNGHGLSDKEMGDFGLWDFEEEIGVTEDEFIDNGMNAYFGIVSKNTHDSKGDRIPRREHDSIIKKAKRDSMNLLQGNDVIEVQYDLDVKAETQKEKAEIIKFLEKNNIPFEEKGLYLTIYFFTIEQRQLFYKNLMNGDSEE